MRIGLNLLYILPSVGGGTYIYALSLIKALAERDHENEYFVFVGREAANLEIVKQSNFRIVRCPIPARRRPVRYAWEQAVLPWQVRRLKIDLLHSLGYVAPLLIKCANVVTIPDVNWVNHEGMSSGRRATLKCFVTSSARQSDHILTISRFSKQEIVAHTKVSSEKVTVTHLGPRAVGTEKTEGLWETLRTQYQLPPKYVVAFSSPSTHKNIPRLVQAFIEATEGLPHKLVLIGHLPDSFRKDSANPAFQNKILTTGFVPDEHVPLLLGHAELFVFPSCYEGFGIPILEAQQAGVAVASSTAGSLPEVAGDGAEFFDPYSVNQMAGVIRNCLTDVELRSSLRRHGFSNLSRFSWNKTAAETLEVYGGVCRKR
jgi:glycosyltransferase involved in cell wall biosynthesis